MEISLKKWTIDDAPQLERLCNRADRTYLSDRMPSPYTRKDAEEYISLAGKSCDGLYRAVLADGTIVGTISIERMQDIRSCDGEIGYFIDSEYSSLGIMTEAVGLMCEEAFREFGLWRITGLVFEPNIASRRVLEKNGFRLEGITKNSSLSHGKTYDLCVYGKIRQSAPDGEKK